jgi:DNA-binding NarL/FixJ family response regulator
MPKMVRDLHPQIVMLDTMLYGSDIPDTLEAIRESWGHTRCVVLVDDPQQVIEAEKAGADLAILEGFPAQKLAAELSTLCGIPVTTCHSKYPGMPSTKISGVKHYGGVGQ